MYPDLVNQKESRDCTRIEHGCHRNLRFLSQTGECTDFCRFEGTVEIRSDAYDFQSYCTLDVFNKAEGKWHEVLRRPYGNMETRHGLHYEPNIKTCNLSLAFARDRQWLIDTYGKLMS